MNLRIAIIVLALSLNVFSIFAQEPSRGFGVKIQNEQGQAQEINLYSESYALIIGASNYKDGFWNDLPGVKKDIPAVRGILIKHGFTVEELADPTSENLLPRINQFVNDYGLQSGNRLLIYFAGHGYTETDGDERSFGYIVPTDAPDPSKKSLEFQRKAVSMDDIENAARKIRSKHALFVFDSCFSGTLLFRSKPAVPRVITYLAAQPVRQFITSGAADQEVPDESVFRQMFVRGLEGEADFNKDEFITATELSAYLQERVIYYRGEAQTPQYGKIRDPKLDRGDFIFAAGKNLSGQKSEATEKPKPNEKINEQPPSSHGKKSGKVFFISQTSVSNKGIVIEDVGFFASDEFNSVLVSKLKEKNLTILTEKDLSKSDFNQYRGINSRTDESSLHFLPVALVFDATIGLMQDLPAYQGLFVSTVSGHFDIIDTDNNKTLGTEVFTEIRGFGNTQDQARRNALKSAAEGISEKFLNLVKDKSK